MQTLALHPRIIDVNHPTAFALLHVDEAGIAEHEAVGCGTFLQTLCPALRRALFSAGCQQNNCQKKEYFLHFTMTLRTVPSFMRTILMPF